MTYKTHFIGDALVAETSDAVAVSEVINQVDGENDFESVRDIETIFYLNDILDATRASQNVAPVISDINEGDRIFVIKQDNTIHETVATNVQISDSRVNPIMTSPTEPSGHATYNGNDITNPFNGEPGNYSSCFGSDNDYLQYEFATPTKITGFYIKFMTFRYHNIYDTYLQASYDGISFFTIYQDSNDYIADNHYYYKTEKVIAQGEYKYYRLKFNGNKDDHLRIYEFSLLTDSGKTIDTTAVTNGEIPKRVYRFNEKILLNSTELVEISNYKTYGLNGTDLYIQSIYDNALISGRTLKTTINFSAPGNQLIELAGRVFKEA
jgi:hypothetical protein